MKSCNIIAVLSLILGLALNACNKTDKSPVQFIRENGDFENKIYHEDEFVDSYHFTLSVDEPVNGSPVLKDSIIVFLNKTLYDIFELLCEDMDSTESVTRVMDEVETKDPAGIVKHYLDAYNPFLDKYLDNYYMLTMTVLCQTDSFITYGVEFHHCGGSCGAELYAYTFSKKDGHLCTIIDAEELDKYAKENPDLTADFYENDYHGRLDYALLDDGIMEIRQDVGNNHYGTTFYELHEALTLPFLSKEARELLDSKGECHVFGEWSLGTSVGEAETTDGATAILTKTVPQWSCYEEIDREDFYSDSFSINAYTIDDGRYILNENGFKTLVLIGRTKDHIIRVDNTTYGYRYSSWKFKDDMYDEPDLVIDNGKQSQAGAGSDDIIIVFENNDYQYVVNESQRELCIFNDGNQIYRQNMDLYLPVRR